MRVVLRPLQLCDRVDLLPVLLADLVTGLISVLEVTLRAPVRSLSLVVPEKEEGGELEPVTGLSGEVEEREGL